MEYVAFIYSVIGIIIALIIFILTYDENDMKDRKPFHRFIVYFLGVAIIYIAWPVWVIIIIRIYYKINKGNYNG